MWGHHRCFFKTENSCCTMICSFHLNSRPRQKQYRSQIYRIMALPVMLLQYSQKRIPSAKLKILCHKIKLCKYVSWIIRSADSRQSDNGRLISSRCKKLMCMHVVFHKTETKKKNLKEMLSFSTRHPCLVRKQPQRYVHQWVLHAHSL